MKVKNIEISRFANSMLGNKHLPMKLSFAIAVNIEEAAAKNKIYEEEKMKLVNKFAKKDENGDFVVEDGRYVFEDQESWEKEVQELLETEVELSITTVTKEDMFKCDEPGFDRLTVNDMAAIKFMIEE